MGLYIVLHRLVQTLAHVADPWNKKLRKDQLQSFDKLSDNEICSMETLKVNLIDPALRNVLCLQGSSNVFMDAFEVEWLPPDTESVGWDRYTNRILFLFIERRRDKISHDPARTSCSTIGGIAASALQ